MRFLMIGGFLGAGKTTALARLARHYQQQGHTVALVTNDQAYGLVDTNSLRSQGFDVGEVPGACFCCKFEDLVETVAQLAEDARPDIILAEPVGSCTDLSATVLRPLAHLYAGEYQLGPLTVLCKPEHGAKILAEGQSGFSPQAAYIFLKQLEEADLIVVNKVDKLTVGLREQLIELVRKKYPEKRIVAISATTGEGFEELLQALTQDHVVDRPTLRIDYDVYAAGEAEMGWLNATVNVQPTADAKQRTWDLDQITISLVQQLATEFTAAKLEPGHVKVLGSTLQDDSAPQQSHTAVANWVATGEPPMLSVASQSEVARARLLINARVASEPEVLARHVRSSVQAVGAAHELDCQLADLQHFSPARPEPTHRYVADSATDAITDRS